MRTTTYPHKPRVNRIEDGIVLEDYYSVYKQSRWYAEGDRPLALDIGANDAGHAYIILTVRRADGTQRHHDMYYDCLPGPDAPDVIEPATWAYQKFWNCAWEAWLDDSPTKYPRF